LPQGFTDNIFNLTQDKPALPSFIPLDSHVRDNIPGTRSALVNFNQNRSFPLIPLDEVNEELESNTGITSQKDIPRTRSALVNFNQNRSFPLVPLGEVDKNLEYILEIISQEDIPRTRSALDNFNLVEVDMNVTSQEDIPETRVNLPDISPAKKIKF
jgi:hypothetical protein